MFRVSQHPSSGVLKTVTAASGTGHNTGTAASLQRGPIGPRWRVVLMGGLSSDCYRGCTKPLEYTVVYMLYIFQLLGYKTVQFGG